LTVARYTIYETIAVSDCCILIKKPPGIIGRF
jgi:hypothetical protein